VLSTSQVLLVSLSSFVLQDEVLRHCIEMLYNLLDMLLPTWTPRVSTLVYSSLEFPVIATPIFLALTLSCIRHFFRSKELSLDGMSLSSLLSPHRLLSQGLYFHLLSYIIALRRFSRLSFVSRTPRVSKSLKTKNRFVSISRNSSAWCPGTVFYRFFQIFDSN